MATFDYQSAINAGYKPEEINAYLSSKNKPSVSKPSGGFLGNIISSITKPFETTGRNIVTGFAQTPLALYQANAEQAAQSKRLPQFLRNLAGGVARGAEAGRKVLEPIGRSEQEMTQMGGNAKTVTDQARASAGVASWGVPFGKGAGVVTKALLPGAAVGALQTASEEGTNLGDIARGAISGTAGAGLLHGAGKALGMIGKGITKKLPEKIMSGVFKEPIKATKSALKKKEPLGKIALEKGIRGSTENIYLNAIQKTENLENTLQQQLQKSTRIIPIADIKTAVTPLIKKYANAGNTSAVNTLTSRLESMEIAHGKSIPIAVANEVKRTLYEEARNAYGSISSETMEGIKAIARALKEKISSKVKGVGNINRELSIQGRIANSILDKMTREGRNNLLSLTNAALFGGAIAAAPATGGVSLAAPALRMALGTTTGQTSIAQGLKRAGEIGQKVSQAGAPNIIKQLAGQGSARAGIGVDSAITGIPNAPRDAQHREYDESAQSLIPHTDRIPQPVKQIEEVITSEDVRDAYLYLDKTSADAIKEAYESQYLVSGKVGGKKAGEGVTLGHVVDEMKRLYGAETPQSISLGKSTVGIPGLISRIGREGQKLTDQEYVDKLNKYSQMRALAAGVINRARQAGVLNEGEFQTMIANMPNEYTSEDVAMSWFDNVKMLLGDLPMSDIPSGEGSL